MTHGQQEPEGGAPGDVLPPAHSALDSSAMVAYLRQEPGWQEVATLLAEPNRICYAHAVNLCEVYYGFARQAGRETAIAAIHELFTDGVVAREDLDPAFWQDVGDMVAMVRNAPGLTLSLADAFGLALARRLQCAFVTTDHGELDPLAPLNLCAIRFIR